MRRPQGRLLRLPPTYPPINPIEAKAIKIMVKDFEARRQSDMNPKGVERGVPLPSLREAFLASLNMVEVTMLANKQKQCLVDPCHASSPP